MDQKEELYRNLLIKKKIKGLENLYFFNKYIVEQLKERRKLIVPHVHGEWVNWSLASKKRIKMILVPRGSLKSTFMTVGGTLQRICRNRNSRILIANATIANAQKFLGEIKEHLTKNEELKLLYGDFFQLNSKWNETEIEVKGRALGTREPTVFTCGVGGNLISQHYDTIFADDLVNAENSATRLQANKVIDWWKRAFSLLDPEGEMYVIGTRFTYYELYSYILDKMGDQVDSYVHGAYNTDGSFYFPEKYNKDKLIELKRLHGSFLFSSFYLNMPIDEDSAIIKKSQILYYETPPENLAIFAMCDPAVSQGVDADYSTIVVAGVDVNDNWYVLEVRREHWQVSELVTNLFEVNAIYNPSTISIEVIGQAQGLLTPIRDEEQRLKKYLPLKEIKSRPLVTKQMRIRSILQPRFENRKVYIKQDMFTLEEELLNFPKASHDDIIDALVDLSEIGYPADPLQPTKVDTGSYYGNMVAQGIPLHPQPVDEVLGEQW
jgi:phage terminase large subunit-like protein